VVVKVLLASVRQITWYETAWSLMAYYFLLSQAPASLLTRAPHGWLCVLSFCGSCWISQRRVVSSDKLCFLNFVRFLQFELYLFQERGFADLKHGRIIPHNVCIHSYHNANHDNFNGFLNKFNWPGSTCYSKTLTNRHAV